MDLSGVYRGRTGVLLITHKAPDVEMSTEWSMRCYNEDYEIRIISGKVSTGLLTRIMPLPPVYLYIQVLNYATHVLYTQKVLGSQATGEVIYENCYGNRG